MSNRTDLTDWIGALGGDPTGSAGQIAAGVQPVASYDAAMLPARPVYARHANIAAVVGEKATIFLVAQVNTLAHVYAMNPSSGDVSIAFASGFSAGLSGPSLVTAHHSNTTRTARNQLSVGTSSSSLSNPYDTADWASFTNVWTQLPMTPFPMPVGCALVIQAQTANTATDYWVVWEEAQAVLSGEL